MPTTTTSARTAAPSVETGPGRWLLPIILLGNVLNVVDTFVVNVALPTLTRTLHAGAAELELIVAGYSVAYACFLVLGGRMGDNFGRRRLFLIGMTGFTVASALCGLAPTADTLIIARLVQGATAALVVPQVLAIIQVTYQGVARQRALGIFGAVMSAAAAIGQILGGVLVSADIFGLSWRPAFLINIPVGIVGIIAGRKVIPESKAPRRAPIDGPGTFLLAATVILLLLPLTLGRDENWPLWCWAMLAATPVAAALFTYTQVRGERRGGLPLLPPSLLRSSGLRRGLAVALAFFASFGGMMLTTTVSLQYGLHFSPVKAGLTLGPYAVAFLAGSLMARRLAARLGRLLPVGGSLLLALGFAGLALQAHAGYADLTPYSLTPLLIVIGLAQSVVVMPIVTIVLADVPADRTGVASGVWATNQQISMAFGVAAIGALFFGIAGSHGYGHATIAAELTEAALALAAAALAWTLPRR
jgi:EmrB/QacA subfamily drug resistance transporter